MVAVLVAQTTGTTAQTLGFGPTGDAPIHIEADNGIEWQRGNQLYLASGNARASQGDAAVEADQLIAYYRPNADGENEIYRIDAIGNVRILSTAEQATGDRAVYDVFNGVLVLTGDTVQLDTGEDTITARDSLEYYEKRQLAVARGDALAVRADRRLKADVLMAHFGKAKGGATGRNSNLDRIEAVGNVLISTQSDIVIAERGDYDLETGLAQLTGGVKITRGSTQLNGKRAEVDLNSGHSRLLSDGERVKGVFLPKASPDRDTKKK
ncbi:MAG: LptA/OstA family protein [Alphaproteobacteria bacterium]